MTPLTVVHLYPRHMALYGDRGNIAVLAARCAWRNIPLQIVDVHPGQALPPEVDLIMLGGGQDVDQARIVQDLLARQTQLAALIHGGAIYLGICGGYQMAGVSYQTASGAHLPGLGLLDLRTVQPLPGTPRSIGNVAATSAPYGKLYGFENHGGRTYLGTSLQPLARVIKGDGNNGHDGGEGVLANLGAGMVLGTYLHGFLPNNPQVADALIARMYKLDEITNLPKLACQLESLLRCALPGLKR